MDTKIEKFLPVGSIVLMKDAKKRIMITGYAVSSPDDDSQMWDYIGCIWPEGMISPDKNLLFNHDKIERVFSVGFTNDEQKKFNELLVSARDLREKRLAREAKEKEIKKFEKLDNDLPIDENNISK